MIYTNVACEASAWRNVAINTDVVWEASAWKTVMSHTYGACELGSQERVRHFLRFMCTASLDGQTDGRMDGRTDRQFN